MVITTYTCLERAAAVGAAQSIANCEEYVLVHNLWNIQYLIGCVDAFLKRVKVVAECGVIMSWKCRHVSGAKMCAPDVIHTSGCWCFRIGDLQR